MTLPAPTKLTPEQRKYFMSQRQTIIMHLGALEELLGLEQSIVPKRKRKLNDETKMRAEDYGIVDRTYYTTED